MVQPTIKKGTVTNLGKESLQIVDKHFPPNHYLHKYINRRKIKISYSCTKYRRHHYSLKQKKYQAKKKQKNRKCNCRKKSMSIQ